MPIKDLLIKNFFADYYNELIAIMRRGLKNKKNKSENVVYYLSRQETMHRGLGKYLIEIYLYSKVTQTPINASLFIVSKKNAICDKELCVIRSSENAINFDDKNKSCIWGSLVTFAIKMNFID